MMTPEELMKAHGIADHPTYPLMPGCQTNHLLLCGLRNNVYHALRKELGFAFTVGELAARYGSDYTAIKGIGRVYAIDLALVLAVFYPRG
jgi:hypothetical protein